MSDERVHEFGKEEEENDGEMVSNKRMKEMSIDWLSSLPDGILMHILSFLGFDVKHAAVTSVLSKRWQFLWSELPILNFCDHSRDLAKTREFVCWVHRTIILRSGAYLEQFGVDFLYNECYASDVNAWVRFAVQNKVKHLSLVMLSGRHFYTLPQVLYSGSYLTRLCLRRCIVDPHGIIEWRCLTRLTVEDVELPDDVIGKILAGCRVLCRLALKSCWGFMRLDVNSKSLCELVKRLQLVNVKSLVRANIHYTVYDNSVEEMNNTKELFEKVRRAKDLILGGQFVENEAKTWHHSRDDLDCDLLHLKLVHFIDFADPNLAGEPMLTIARILLKRATTLEKMVIDAEENLIEFR
ncbi:putative F-box/LRR-repeat protein at5g02930 [Phtheirospermum japonicum]|uniref:Putative F-box/LRR-repeat protein at5g02930 n=1 Tax=Phtheirospermum japonicum TaxID=374723 RepID=A0A830B096_9LAMI|nr:putative F-box/LRR-repeat protein at5g02930 [Phtheirospermum japonicum]